jgi:signal transduction histidine kinase
LDRLMRAVANARRQETRAFGVGGRGPLRAVTSGADPRELPLVLGLLAALLAEGHWSSDGNGLSPAGVAAAVGIVLPLLWRHRAPHIVLALVVVGVFACLATLKPSWSVLLPSAVAIYTVALHGNRLRSLAAAACVVGVTAVVMAVFSEDGVFHAETLVRLGFLLLALVVGDAVRSRRRLLQSALEREADRERRSREEADRRIADERLRIAQEVHDVVAHAMVAINVQAGVAAHVLQKRPGQAETALTEIKRVSGEALADLRATLGLLRDEGAAAPVHPARELSEVRDLAAPLRAAGVDVDIAVRGPQERVPSAVGAAAYRIVQEALTNVLRHADASSAAVQVAIGARALEIEVRNDGVPAPGGPSNGSGTGLRGMAERAEALGGRVEAGQLADGGWQVRAVLPLAPPPAFGPGAQPPGGGTPPPPTPGPGTKPSGGGTPPPPAPGPGTKPSGGGTPWAWA